MARRGWLLAWVVVVVMVAVNAPGGDAHNITAVLEGSPEYSLYNDYMTRTKVADEINTRETVTCLVLPNAAMATLASKGPLAAVKNALRLLTLLDYFDPTKLHNLPGGATFTTTLLQTTGSVTGNQGFVNITNARGGKVTFSSAVAGSKPDATYTKSIKEIPYNLSVLEVSAPIVFPGLFDAASTARSNLTALLENAGCKTFAFLISSSGVLQMFQSATGKGLTVFAPNDEAFKARGVPDLSKLSSAALVTLLQYHALPSYTPKASLKMQASGRIATMASNAAGKYDLGVKVQGDDVSLVTGVDTSRVASTVFDDAPVCLLTVDSVLLPIELFAPAPAPAPGPSGKAPSPTSPAPTATPPAPPTKKAPAPSPMPLSPPAPPMDAPAPASSPAEGPGNENPADESMAAGTTILGTLVVILSALCALGSIL
ncbi:hypothetical protein J5N97_021662 [Dioscorea zingiberensis]|uniref:FAS1 domain-containing protein n=1 Tax=Dioscorea zingiberensis TaxID=325984 RepID=A0A9D5CAE8_9LILI|nr:hypothetical protein J5N97_021662 [Dioscorea zingiberensis]